MLEDIQCFVAQNFPRFGKNKAQEITRLLYEIEKREGIPSQAVIEQSEQQFKNFPSLKKYLLSRRFPSLNVKKPHSYSLPRVNLKTSFRANIKKEFYFKPGCIYIEKSVVDSALAGRMRQRFSGQIFHEIESHKEFLKTKESGINQYNHRCENLFIVKERFDFFFPCPCSDKSVSCGYHIFNLGVGCPFECVYCHLQGYTNSPGLVIPANIEDYLADFKQYPQSIRLGSGQFTDSLALDPLTEYSQLLVDFFRQRPHAIFEFKTKSANVDGLLHQKSCENIVIAWSMNPPKIIASMEYHTASFNQRLGAAIKCTGAGYKTAFHFDPVIRIPDWENEYKEIINKIFSSIAPIQVAWISIGGLRMSPKLKKIIENRFPDTDLLNEELILGFDRKLRYPLPQRIDIYKKIIKWIRHHNKTTPVYLCMEAPQVYRACQLDPYRY